MNYQSTRDRKKISCTAGEAICRGIAPDGGLYLPESCPKITREELKGWIELSYTELACRVLAPFLTDYSAEQIKACVEGAYAPEKFSASRIAPTKNQKDFSLLELWHGPTCAFKDMALQLLPRLMVTARQNLGVKETSLILVATSGDTGKAALEGFADVPGTDIAVFYPKHGVSALQQLQMQTQEGSNVAVFGIEGNFDDAQTGVKQLFTDPEMLRALKAQQMCFSSANSINWGRLCPQIVYYFASYADLVHSGRIAFGDEVNFCVPTGNFGDILAGYYAKEMGLPVHKLICASNKNRVLTDFFASGTYNRNRTFFQTASPSMDILISSNLERLLYLLYDQDAEAVCALFRALNETGSYTVSDAVKEKLNAVFAAGSSDDEASFATISSLFKEENTLIDPHTAVGVSVYQKYKATTGDQHMTVVLSTASPYKFCKDVLHAVTGKAQTDENPFGLLSSLEETSGVAAPVQMKALAGKKIRFTDVLKKEELSKAVQAFLEK